MSPAAAGSEPFGPGRRFDAVCAENPYHVDGVALGEIERLEPAAVLDVGCADGRFARELRAERVIGIELDADLARSAAAVCEHVITGDVQDPRVLAEAAKRGPYDLVLALDVVEHLAAPEDALRRLAATLSPGGRLLIGVPNLVYYRERVRLLRGRFETSSTGGLYDRTHLSFFSKRELTGLLDRAGLDVERLTGAGNVRPGRRIAGFGSPARALHLALSAGVHRAAQVRPELLARSLLAVARPRR